MTERLSNGLPTDPSELAEYGDLLGSMQQWVGACTHHQVGAAVVLNAAIECARTHLDPHWLASALRRAADAIEAAEQRHMN